MTTTKFRNGNLAHRTHGAMSDRVVNPIAREVAAGLFEKRPDLSAYPESVWAWARVETQALLIHQWFDDNPVIDKDGNPAPALRPLARFESLASKLRAELGLTPKAEADLARSRADASASVYDLDALRKAGREALERRGSA